MMKRIIRTSALKNGFFKEDRFLISLILLFGMGLLAGSVAVARSNSYISEIWQGYIIYQETKGFASLFLGTFCSFIIIIIINYVLGHCAIGKPFLYPVVLVYGIGRGIVFSSYYVNGDFGVFFKICLALVVQNSFMVMLVLSSAKTSAEHSRKIYDYGYRGKDNNLNLRQYNRKYYVYCFLAVMLCLIDSIIVSRFFYN